MRHLLHAIVLMLLTEVALGAPPPLSVPISSEQALNGQPVDLFAFLSNLKRSNFLLGDMFGVRPWLSRYGVSLFVQETSEELGNASGGTKTGAAYDGLTQVILQMDTQRALGHYGGLFNLSALQIHGSNLSADQLLTLQTASGIEADRATRLWELWYDQKFLEEDRLDVRVGQESLDQEFIVSNNAAYFINTMFGWPALPSYDLPGGGPAYPLSALGVRLRYRPINAINLLLGLFNGSPVKNNTGDPQQQNNTGTRFPLNGGTLTFVEFQYAYPSVGSMAYPGEAAPLARTYKVGAWYDSEEFSDLRFDTNGVPLASPASNGAPASHHGNFSPYAVADQMLWRNAGDPNNTLSMFARAMGTPLGDRNLIRSSVNAGLVYHEPFRNRPDDTLGLGLGYVHVSDHASGYDSDVATDAPAGSYNPIRSSETYVEATYQYQVRPWCQLQPDIQYVFNPGGGIVDPNLPTQRIQNELVLGLRTNILF
ncbi:MAG: carbohydrate porin [Thiobacillaceae bacterium]